MVRMKPPNSSHSLFSTSPTTRRHHGIKAFLTVDGEAREVYDMKEYEGRVEGCVLGEAGKKFEVVLYDGREKEGVELPWDVNVCIGGQHVAGVHCPVDHSAYMRQRPIDDEYRFTRFGSVRIDENYVCPFCFGKVPTTEDETAACTSADYLDNVSVIKVEYWRITPLPEKDTDPKKQKEAVEGGAEPAEDGPSPKRRRVDPLEKGDRRMVYEQSDKASFALSGSFGDLVTDPDPRQAEERAKSSSNHARLGDKPVLTFIFKIRSQVWLDRLLTSQQSARVPSPPPKTVSIGNTLYLDFDEDEAKADAAASSSKKQLPHQDQVAPKPEADVKDEGRGAEDVNSSSFAPQQSKDKKKEIRPSPLTFGNHISPAPQFSRLASRLAQPQVNKPFGSAFGRPSSATAAAGGSSSASSSSFFSRDLPPPPRPRSPSSSFLPRSSTSSSYFAGPTAAGRWNGSASFADDFPLPRPPTSFGSFLPCNATSSFNGPPPPAATANRAFSTPTVVEEDSYTPPPRLPHPMYESQASQQEQQPGTPHQQKQQQQEKKEEMEILNLASSDGEEDLPPARPAGRRGTPFAFSVAAGGM